MKPEYTGLSCRLCLNTECIQPIYWLLDNEHSLSRAIRMVYTNVLAQCLRDKILDCL